MNGDGVFVTVCVRVCVRVCVCACVSASEHDNSKRLWISKRLCSLTVQGTATQ